MRTAPATAGLVLLLLARAAGAAPAKDFAALKTPAEIYAGYREARALAPAILKALERDKGLYEALDTAENRKDKAVMRRLIEASAVSTAPAIVALLANFDDFTIDSYEGGLVCEADQKRWLDRLEAKGPSPESWRMRSEYLSQFARVELPWCGEELCEGVSFDSLVGALTETKGRYERKPYRQRFSAWVQEEARRLEASVGEQERFLKAVRCDEGSCARQTRRGRVELTRQSYESLKKAFPDQAKEVRDWAALVREFSRDPGAAAQR